MEKSQNKIPRLTLKAWRVNKKLSLKEASKQLGISEYTLGNYEAGIILFFYPNVTV